MENWYLVLLTSDAGRITIKHADRDRVLKHFQTIANAVEDATKSPGECVEVPLTTVSTDSMKRMLEFSAHHKENFVEVPAKSTVEIEKMYAEEWNKQFFEQTEIHLRDQMTRDVNFLNYRFLMSTLCYHWAQLIKTMTPEAIREMFNLPDDLTPEQKELIKTGVLPDELK